MVVKVKDADALLVVACLEQSEAVAVVESVKTKTTTKKKPH